MPDRGPSLADALPAYDALYARLRAHAPERTWPLIDVTYAEGRARIESIVRDPLSDAERELLAMYLASAGSDDPDAQMLWLDLLPESLERLGNVAPD